MNPFANVGDFEALRLAALLGQEDYARHVRRMASGDRRELGVRAELQLAARTRRMVQLAVAAHRAVLLVGPPGTGKTELLAQVIADARNDPARYGLGTDIDALWVTPEEEWTFETVVLGETVVKGEVSSVEGYLLEALRTNQWLILDEANRADLDRVLGGVLTWLTEKRVRIGSWREQDGTSRPVFLDWSRDDEARLVAAQGAGSRDYVAGRDWRLLGTYNPTDAQRVFRMGQALGRRFKHVPILPPSGQDFETIIRGRISRDELVDPLAARLRAIYDAHLDDGETQIGPGLLVDIPAYLEAALALPDLAVKEAEDASSGAISPVPHGIEQHAAARRIDLSYEKVGGDAALPIEYAAGEHDDDCHGETPAPTLVLGELLAEAYLMSVGHFLMRREELIAELGDRMTSRKAFTEAEWAWITQSLTTLHR